MSLRLLSDVNVLSLSFKVVSLVPVSSVQKEPFFLLLLYIFCYFLPLDILSIPHKLFNTLGLSIS